MSSKTCPSVTESPVVKKHNSLPPLIHIDQTIPVGYTNSNSYQSNQTSEPSSPVDVERKGPDEGAGEMTMTEETNQRTPPSASNTPTDLSDMKSLIPVPLVDLADHDRPERMRDWLVRMINSGRFPGLKWLDREKMIFRVPWIHAKKRDYNQERDAALFREWAIHSGKFGDGSDVTTWKINFRCALNGLKDIIERRELEEPDCRVYQMLPSTNAGRRRKRRRTYYSEILSYQPPDKDARPRLDPLSPNGSLMSTPTPTSISMLPLVNRSLPLHLPLQSISSPTTPMSSSITPLGVVQTFKTVLPGGFKTSSDDHASHVSREAYSLPQTPSPSTPHVISPAPASHPEVKTVLHATPTFYPLLRSGPVYCPPMEFANSPTALIIRILYGSITVHMETIDCSKGCRIFYGPLHCRTLLGKEEEEKLFGPLEACQVALSPRHPAPLANTVFKTLKRGLVLEVEDGAIYATALCQAVVYYGTSPVRHATSLQKEQRCKVFDYHNGFASSLRQSSEVHLPLPKPYAIFSLGQPWGPDRPLSGNLITIVATCCQALNDLRVRNLPIYDDLLFEAQESKDVRILSPTSGDFEAEEFLNPRVEVTPSSSS
eukprot:Em0008g1083a